MKTGTGKRFLATLLCVLMFVSLFPVSAFAGAENGGEDEQLEEVKEIPDVPDEGGDNPDDPDNPVILDDNPDDQNNPDVVKEETNGHADDNNSLGDDGNQGEISLRSSGTVLRGVVPGGDDDGGDGDGEDDGEEEDTPAGNRGLTAPTSWTDLTVESFPLSVNLAEGEQSWYKLTAPVSGDYTINADAAASVEVYDDEMVQLAYSVGDSFWLNNGYSAYILVTGAAQALLTLDISFDFSAIVKPEQAGYQYDEYMSDRAEITAVAGEDVTLAVSAVSDFLYNVRYTWYGPDDPENPLAVTTNDTYTIENITRAGNYDCVVTDGFDHWSTVTFAVGIENDIVVSLSGEGVRYNEFFRRYECGLTGSSRTFTAVVTSPSGTGDTNVTYRWYQGHGSSAQLVSSEASYTVQGFDGLNPVTCSCAVIDNYGNSYYLTLYVFYDNGFSLAADVDRTEWSVNDEYHTAAITLPAENTGVTMKVAASGSDLTESSVEYSWSISSFDGGPMDPDESIDRTTDTLVLGQVSQPLRCEVYANDQHGNSESFIFYVMLENWQSSSLILTPAGEWPVDDEGRVQVALDPGNEGTQLGAWVESSDETVSAKWYKKTADDEEWSLVEEQPTVSANAVCSLLTGTITVPTEFRVDVTDSADTRTLYFDVFVESAASPMFSVQPELPEGFNIQYSDINTTSVKGTLLPDSGAAALRFTVVADSYDSLTVVNGDGNAYGEELQYADSQDPENPGRTYTYAISEMAARNYSFEISDGNGNHYFLSYDLKVENGLTVRNLAPISEDSFRSDYIENTNLVVNPGDELEFRFSVTAVNKNNLTVINPDTEEELEPDDPEADTWIYTVRTSPINEAKNYCYVVTDVYGNTFTIQYSVILPNHFTVTPVIPEGVNWTCKTTAGIGGSRVEVHGNIPKDTTSIPLQIRVEADDLTKILATPYAYLNEEDRIPPEEHADYNLYAWTFNNPFNETPTFSIKDGYGSRTTVVYCLSAENNFSVEVISPENITVLSSDEAGQYVKATIPAGSEEVSLQIAVKAADESGLIVTTEEDESLSPAGRTTGGALIFERVIPYPDANGYYEFDVDDGFGNRKSIRFLIAVENNLCVEAVLQSRAWKAEYDGGVAEHVTGPVPENADVTVQIRVTAADTEKIFVAVTDADGIQCPFELDDSSPEALIYSCTIPGPQADWNYRNFFVSDGYGNTYNVSFNLFVPENNLTAEAVLEKGWSGKEDHGEMIAYCTLPTNNNGTTLRIRASADDITNMYAVWENGGENQTYSPTRISTTSVEFQIAIPGPITSVLCDEIWVMDSYGNSVPVRFEVYLDNGLHAEAIVPDGCGWTVESDPAFHLEAVNGGPISPEEPITLQIAVSALNKDDLRVMLYEYSRNNHDPAFYELDPIDDNADTWVYSYTVTPQIKFNEPLNYSFEVLDCYGNPYSVSFYLTVENNLYVEAVAPADLETEYEEEHFKSVTGTISGAEPVTLQIAVHAINKDNLNVFGFDPSQGGSWGPGSSPLEPEDRTAETWVYSRTFDPPFNGPIDYCFSVDDGLGNYCTVEFKLTIENGFEVNVTGIPEDWQIWDYSEEYNYTYVSGMISGSEPVSLQVEVKAADRSKLRVSVFDLRQMENDPVLLQPADPDADTLVYSYTIDSFETWPYYRINVDDGLGSEHNVYCWLQIQNHFRATASNGQYYQVMSVKSGSKATLKLNVGGDKLDKLTIDWLNVENPKDQNNQGAWKTVRTTHGKQKAYSYTTPKITKDTLYIARVSDGYGTNIQIAFFVNVTNKLSLKSTVGSAAGNYNGLPLWIVNTNRNGRTLKVSAGASNASGLKIYWYDTEPDGYYENGSAGVPYWNTAPVKTVSGKSADYVLSDRDCYKTYYAQAVDRFGNTATIAFEIQGFSAYAADTTETYQEISVTPGEELTLSVDSFSDGQEVVQYQWHELTWNGDAWDSIYLPGENLSSYTISAVEHTGDYCCTATYNGSSITINFHVIAENHLSAQPQYNQYVVALKPGESLRLVAIIDDEDWSLLEGADNAIPIIVNKDRQDSISWFNWYRVAGNNYYAQPETVSDDGKVVETPPMSSRAMGYWLEVGDQYGNYANTYIIQVEYDNNFSAHAAQDLVTIASGKKATLKVIATGNNTKGVKYQWCNANGEPIKGATKASYTTPAIKKQTEFRCMVTDSYGNLTWVGFMVQVQNNLILTALTESPLYVQEGEPATLAVKATAKNAGNLYYTWYDANNNVLAEGAEASSYTIEQVTAETYGDYYCKATDTYGNTAWLTFFVGIENGFRVAHTDDFAGNYTVFVGQEKTLDVDVSIIDAGDYTDGWWIQLSDNACTYWKPLLESDEPGEIHNSYPMLFDQAGTYTFCYEGKDKYGTNSWVYFTVKVLDFKNYQPAAPSLAKTEGGITVTFETVPAYCDEYYDVFYIVQRKVGSGKYQTLTTLSGLEADEGRITLVDTNVKSNTKYTYKVIAVYDGISSKQGKEAAITAYVPAGITRLAVQTNGVQVTWTKVAGAKSYRLERKVADGGWETAANKVTKLTYTDQKAVSGEYNSYRVIPLDKKGNPLCEAAESLARTVYYLAAPNFTVIFSTKDYLPEEDVVEISWNDVPGATGYLVERQLSAKRAAWEIIRTVDAADGTITEYDWPAPIDAPASEGDLLRGKTYNYRVTALNEDYPDDEGNPQRSASVTRSVSCSYKPTVTSVRATGSGMEIIWNKTQGAASYRVWRTLDGVQWNVVADRISKAATKTTFRYVDTSVGYQESYAYRVQALNKSGVAISEASEYDYFVLNDQFLAVPTLRSVIADTTVTADAERGGIVVSWSPVACEESYEVQYQVLRKAGKAKTWVPVGEVTTELSCRDMAVANKTAYTYAVRAFVADEEGNPVIQSNNSASKSATYYQTPVVNSVKAVSGGGATITWSAVSGAAKYRVLRYDAITNQWIVIANAVKGTKYTDKVGLYSDEYCVQALDKKGKAISTNSAGMFVEL